MNPIEILIFSGSIAGSGTICFLLGALLGNRKARHLERRAWRQMENLMRARAIEDRRNDTRAW